MQTHDCLKNTSGKNLVPQLTIAIHTVIRIYITVLPGAGSRTYHVHNLRLFMDSQGLSEEHMKLTYKLKERDRETETLVNNQ